ncbi:MAG: MBOAT family protein [Acidobacteriota bacterium]|nr:MBOAT family protein [Acidobacteriota bacterium]
MFFNSYEFLFGFLPAVCILYFLLARVPNAGTWCLAAASLFFYARYRLDGLALLVASMFWNYSISLLVLRRRNKRGWLILGIAVNLAVLSVFKYSKILAPALLSHHLHASILFDLAFPLGISFFTFSQIAYLVDVYKGHDQPSAVRDYILFVTFFPHLLSGPILRHREMVPQFESALRRRPIPRYFARGIALIVIGLAKKTLIADSVAPLVARAFDAGGAFDASTAWLGTTAYTFQLYNDFSGYCDIAVGISFLFNIRIPENFRSPYRSSSIQEFWRRWHISLGRFLRNYVYVPLGGNRAGLFRQCLAILITFTLGGLWHGAGWTFFLWGALHGSALAAQVLWKRFGFRLPAPIGWILTFAFVDLSWVVFRAPDIATLRRVFSAMFSGLPAISFGPTLAETDPGKLALLAAILLAALPAYSFTMARRMKPRLWSAALGALLLTTIALRFASVSYFLYYFF